MKTDTQLAGTRIATEARDSAQTRTISAQKPRFVHELLLLLQADPQAGMLRTTAGHVASFLGVKPDQLAIDQVAGLSPTFKTYLRGRKYSRNSIRSYWNYVAILRKKAKEQGWTPAVGLEVPSSWKPILSALDERNGWGCAAIVRYAIERRKEPSEFSDLDLDSWARSFLAQGRTFEYVRARKAIFRRILFEAGLSAQTPQISRLRVRTYGVPISSFPPELRDEVKSLLDWKQAPYAEGRSRRQRLRPITAKELRYSIERLYGFVLRTEQEESGRKPRALTSLIDLVTRRNVAGFIEFLLNGRKVQGEVVLGRIGSLYAALKQHPKYKNYDFSWFTDLLKGVQPHPESEIRARKEAKYLPFEVLADIPRRIRAHREEATLDPQTIAYLVHDELLISWLIVLPWRQRNIRECRLAPQADGGNLFKSTLSPFSSISKPQWVKEKVKLNPDEPFWQYRFREGETKTGREVRSIVPARLIRLLEEYLQHHRPLLLKGTDPGTLFLNRKGKPLSLNQMSYWVSNLTLQHAERRVTPHLFRDIFAFWWLENHPEDYLTVSKKLWHRNIQTTLQVYGCRFDEAQADCRVEEWVEKQSAINAL